MSDGILMPDGFVRLSRKEYNGLRMVTDLSINE